MSSQPDESRPPIVLIANDHEWSARSLETLLVSEGYRVLRTFTGRQAVDQARAEAPDAVILDAQMPDLSGFEVARLLRQEHELGPSVPIFIATAGPSDRVTRLAAFEAGAWDFLALPLDGETLKHKLRTFLGAKLAGDRLRRTAQVDAETGFYNEQGFVRRADEVVADARRRHAPVAMAVISLDLPGQSDLLREMRLLEQRLVAEVGQVMKVVGRASDVVGRIGPLEFGLVASGADADAALRMLARYRAALSERLPDQSTRLEIRAGFVAGWKEMEEPLLSEELLRRAKAALERADSGEPFQRYLVEANHD
ncbi:MAG: response regulator [Gemmatimonadota bacterium]